MTMHTYVMPRARRVAPLALAAILALGACGSDGDGTAEQPLPTAPTTPPTTVTDPQTVPASTPPTTPAPPSTSPVVPEDQRYEVITTVIEDADGPRLCFDVLDSLPPRCGTGLVLNDWSWDDIGVEQVRNDVTWVDSIYVTGTYDDAAHAFTVDGAGIPSDADRERLMRSSPMPDLSVPCAPPADGWPSPTGVEWPADRIAAIDGYAGAWRDEGQQVMTVKFTGDLTAAEAAIRELYADPLCVVGAERSEAELTAIQQQLLGMSSVQLLDAWVHVDASGEWIEAHTIAPDASHQAAFDTEFGPGVVRLEPVLHPVV